MKVNRFFDYIGKERKKWEEFIKRSDNLQEMKEIREQTRRGRPLGEVDFIKRLEKKLNRFLLLKPRGRPKKDR